MKSSAISQYGDHDLRLKLEHVCFVFLLLEGQSPRTGSPTPPPDLVRGLLCRRTRWGHPGLPTRGRNCGQHDLGLTVPLLSTRLGLGCAASHTSYQIMEERIVQGDRCYKQATFFFFHEVCVPGGTPFSAQGVPTQAPWSFFSGGPTPLVFLSKFNSGYEPLARHTRDDCSLTVGFVVPMVQMDFSWRRFSNS